MPRRQRPGGARPVSRKPSSVSMFRIQAIEQNSNPAGGARPVSAVRRVTSRRFTRSAQCLTYPLIHKANVSAQGLGARAPAPPFRP